MTIADIEYEGVKPLIHKTVRIFAHKHNILPHSQEDLYGAAEEAYAKARLSYDPSQGSFPAWIRYKVWKGLLSHVAQEVKWQKAGGRRKDVCDLQNHLDHIPSKERFYLPRFLVDLSEDACFVVYLTITLPIDVRLVLLSHKNKQWRSENSPTAIRHAIRVCLSDNGWTQERINKAFTQVKEALLP